MQELQNQMQRRVLLPLQQAIYARILTNAHLPGREISRRRCANQSYLWQNAILFIPLGPIGGYETPRGETGFTVAKVRLRGGDRILRSKRRLLPSRKSISGRQIRNPLSKGAARFGRIGSPSTVLSSGAVGTPLTATSSLEEFHNRQKKLDAQGKKHSL